MSNFVPPHQNVGANLDHVDHLYLFEAVVKSEILLGQIWTVASLTPLTMLINLYLFEAVVKSEILLGQIWDSSG